MSSRSCSCTKRARRDERGKRLAIQQSTERSMEFVRKRRAPGEGRKAVLTGISREPRVDERRAATTRDQGEPCSRRNGSKEKLVADERGSVREQLIDSFMIQQSRQNKKEGG